ncbi:MAG: dihydroorotate dehydrogenase [Clostridia bacterium]
MIDLSVNIAGVVLKNPVMTASGTYGFGREYSSFFAPYDLGAVTMKGLTLEKRDGNKPPRICETPGGILNSVGLQNPGVDAFIKNDLPLLKEKNTVVIANIAGNTINEYCRMVEILSDTNVDLIEVNISCPNVKEGGAAFGTNCNTVFDITKAVKAVSKKPLIIKLSPNVTSISEIAKAAESGGADALSLINTLLGMRIDIKTKKPILFNNKGGMSGGAVLPIAVRMVHEVRQVTKLPIIGMGGISTAFEAIEMMMAGANAVSIGTAMFSNPYAPIEIINGISEYMENNNITKVSDITSSVILN